MRTPNITRLFIDSSDNAVPVFPVTAEQWEASAVQKSLELHAKIQGFKGKAGQVLIVPDANGGKIQSVVLGIDSPDSVWSLSSAAAKLPEGDYIITDSANLTENQAYKALIGWGLGQYKFRFDTENKSATSEPEKIRRLVVPQRAADRLHQAVSEIQATWKARDLINLPANILGTRELANEFLGLVAKFNMQSTLHEFDTDSKRKMFPLIWEVGKGATEVNPPFLGEASWSGSEADFESQRIMLTGKGVTFDSGGTQVKPGDSMIDMRKDMGGAATAMALAHMIMANNLPVHLSLMIPIVENMGDGKASKAGDLVWAHDGTPVRVTHTDAEGRLICADAQAYGSKKYKPDLSIAFMTLTGAQRAADGYDVGGVFTPDIVLGRALEDLSVDWSDELNFHRLHEHIHGSKLRDHEGALMSSPRGQYPGATLAALFSQHFAKSGTYVHFDINGFNVSGKPGKPKGGELMGARTMYRYIEQSLKP